jgi:hypothetical protein
VFDWEKAFDKIDHGRLIRALRRLNIPEKYIKPISNICAEPKS